jgi:nucleotide-binding universal stress UspA family protein
VFNSIVVALDLESNVHRALPVARSLAELGGLPIQLLTVSAAWMSEEIDTYELEHIATGHGVTPHSCVIEHDDDVGRAIARHVNDSQGSLLVMATTAKAPIGHHALGTVTESVLTHVAAPVLLVGPRVSDDFALGKPTLVACVDETGAADAALPVIAAWAGTFGGGRAWVAEVASDLATRGHSAAVPRVRQYADWLRANGLDVSWRVLHGADPARSLENFALTVEDAVLVASSARWTDWEPHLHSATRRLVHASTRPVLVVAARRDLSAEVNPTALHGADR